MAQSELARLVGREDSYISMILAGRRKPSRREIPRWAGIMGLTPEERAEFMELAGLAHSPEWIVREYWRMKRR